MEKNIKKLGKKVSINQKELLVTFFEQNLDLARGRFESVDGNRDMRNKWDEVAELLNAAGGANKDGEKWKRTWTDLRLYLKNRAAEIKSVANKSGINGFSRQKTLSDIEERIINIISWNAVVGEHNAAPESGLPKNLSNMNSCPVPSTSTATDGAIEIIVGPIEHDTTININASALTAPRIPRVQTTDPPTLPTRRRKLSLEDIMEDSLLQEKRRNNLLEKQLEIDREKIAVERLKVAALNEIAEAINRQSNNNNNLYLNEEYLD